jgi:hypothetical protein
LITRAADVSRIVTYVHRPKRPPRKRKSVALPVPAVVARKRNKADAAPSPPAEDRPTPANDDRKPRPHGARKPAIVTATKRKQAKLRRAEERATEEPDVPEADARVKAFIARMIKPP